MKITSGKVILMILAICCLILLYPREVTLAPEAELTVYYEDGRIGKNVEVSRNSNSYRGDGWKASLAFTDENGKVKFKAAKRRFPIIAQAVLTVVAPFLHYYAGNAGSFNARDPQNHKIWERIDYRDSNCCPSKIVMKSQESELNYMTFGDLVSE
ncbi:MAG TPA: hypothetical protein VNI84_18485 [Pyrinomonadaceae bacterium]|nr:hypothetical protein [Pyrinomonadaceae bacterium]